MLKASNSDNSIKIVAAFFLVIFLAIIVRLAFIQIWEHGYYETMALNTHEIYKKLYPKRGTVFFQNLNSKQTYAAALNRRYYQIFAVPRDIPPAAVASTSEALAQTLGLSAEVAVILPAKLSKPNDLYEPVAKKIDDDTLNKLLVLKLPGINYTPEEYRYYPEEILGANVLGFCRQSDSGQLVGNYGLEGYWDKTLAGSSGFMMGEKGRTGGWVAATERLWQPAEDGADLKLTIDRSLQHVACLALENGLKKFKAKSAALVMMDPGNGQIMAMCSYPAFDPNNYAVADMSAFNNSAIFTAYEPGSVIKAITMAVGIDLGLVDYNTQFTDPCVRKIEGREIRNAQDKCYGRVTMTNVLENSINTGVIWVQEKIGNERFKKYLDKFGFGKKTGIALDKEVGGDISNLSKKGAIFGATASFGQGITVTPLQLAVAYSAIANGGKLFKPQIVEEIKYPDGRIEKILPTELEVALAPRTAKMVAGMLTSVVENGHSKVTRLPRYYIAAKTGTAQIAGPGGWLLDATNHTFAGFAPANNPRFVIVVKYEMPDSPWADMTTGPVFKEITEFALNYLGVPTDR